ncbi:class I SAM-dependent methyltransferase [Lysobacter arvi]|uniref:Class I SAM-dependent methyltransferase n=1 Tax=Lysobacter arvi TaxID=3038776 RepID=A0ABU1C9Q0_9GAMM|nr:class I SAM-dependent methyltransferase [Lysobacter arvi]MDR0181917.1 class I SAM-dependent methyltransferase [Lysobacter arvi]
MSSFHDAASVAHYAQGPVRQVPGFHALHRMTELLLAEHVPDDGRILVLGAGGGLELAAFAEARPRWRFVGVDPSAPMLALAERTLGPHASRAELIQGEIDAAPAGPFDGATCLLTLHFLDAGQRLHALQQLRERLRPGAPLVVAHHSIPQEPDAKSRWLGRYASFAASSGIAEADARRAADGIGSRLPLLSPEQDASLLTRAGFTEPELFYAAFTFRGWVARRPLSSD